MKFQTHIISMNPINVIIALLLIFLHSINANKQQKLQTMWLLFNYIGTFYYNLHIFDWLIG